MGSGLLRLLDKASVVTAEALSFGVHSSTGFEPLVETIWTVAEFLASLLELSMGAVLRIATDEALICAIPFDLQTTKRADRIHHHRCHLVTHFPSLTLGRNPNGILGNALQPCFNIIIFVPPNLVLTHIWT